uniref:Myosin light chain kinase, smooth muscle n=1 Tax=Callorhinchus milii TaxID=7868 RepID=A0A4W3HZ15_CALMI|eukprot:gi/632945559/ref/XP_007888128.1/ PREDICTED: myosin light chain kinase, smooth muscle isoform X1 [Callorhinchus milii]
MGDVQIASTTTRISKTTLTLERPQANTLPPEAPAFILPPRNTCVPLGGTARFDGKVRGHPEPGVRWYKNGRQSVPNGERHTMEQSARGTFSFVITAVQVEDAGKYTCEVANASGVRQVTVELSVQGDGVKKYGLSSNSKTSGRLSIPSIENRPSIWGESPPKFVTRPTRLIVKEGQNSKFSCKITGRPHPQVTWLKGDSELQQSDRFSVVEKSGIHYLEIRAVRLEDAGSYTCSLMNNSGKASSSAELLVQSTSSTSEITSMEARRCEARIAEPLQSKITATNGVHQTKRVSSSVTIQPKESEGIMRGIAGTSDKPKDKKNEERTAIVLQENKSGQELKTEVNKDQQLRVQSTVSLQQPKLEMKQTRSTIMHMQPKSSCDVTTDVQSKRVHSVTSSTQQRPQSTVTTDVQKKSSQNVTTDAQLKHSQNVTTSTQQKTLNTITLQPHRVREPSDKKDVPGEQTDACKTVAPQWTSERGGVGQHSHAETGKPSVQLESRKIAREQISVTRGSPPDFVLRPQSQTAAEGEEVKFKCKTIGSPKPEVEWTKDGVLLTGNAGVEVYEESCIHHLRLKHVHVSDRGSYSCTATNSRGQVSTRWTLTVRGSKVDAPLLAPLFTSVLKECTVSEGQDFVLQCAVKGTPMPHVTWLVNEKPIQYAHSTFENGVAKLSVQDALPEDDGIYTCVAENSSGRVSCSAKVSVQERKTSRKTARKSTEDAKKTFAPRILKDLTDLQVMDGSQVRMTIQVEANPTPEIIWLHNGKEIQESEDFQFEKNGNEYSLFIQEVFPEDTGKYMCEAWNDIGEVQTQAMLTVQEPQDGIQPWFISKPKAVTSTVGAHALISCAIAGDPFPQVQWIKDGQAIAIGEDCEVLQNEDVFTLLIRNVQLHQAGQYEIMLKNQVGKCSCHVSLVVIEGSFPQDEAHIDNKESKAGLLQDEEEGGGNGIRKFGTKKTVETTASPEEQKAFGRVLRRKVETKERSEEQLKQLEAEQKDFRSVLCKKVITKSLSEEELKERTAEQMSFRKSLSPHVKPKEQFEDGKKFLGPQQVDFRAVLGKKTIPKIPQEAKITSKPAQPDFRSVLASKKKGSAEKETNNDTENIQPAKEDLNDNVACDHGCLCVDGEVNEKPKGPSSAPVLKEALKNVQVADGARLVLQCQVVAEQSPVITWTVDGKAVKSSKFMSISREGSLCTLNIEAVLPEDEGQYKCIAENSAGRVECACLVSVTDPTTPKTPKATEKKLKKVKSNIIPTLDTDCAEATIKKKPTPKTTPKPAAVPHVLQCPGDVKVRSGESVELLCKFSGTQPFSYTWSKFKRTIVENAHIKIENTDTSSKLIILSSKPDNSGCYTLLVENKIGNKQVPVNVTVVDRPDPPSGKPCSSDVRSSTLTLSWYGPTYDGGSVVQSYVVEVWNSVEQQWTDLTTCRSTAFCVSDLSPDKEYKFRVRAVNVYGTSEPSQESDLVRVGEKEEHKEEADLSDDDEKESEPDYRDVTVNTTEKVADYYNILEKIGTGKFGQVYRLSEKKTGKVWAGKFFKAFSAKDKENVRLEISIMNCLHHQKLVQCIDAFESKSDIVMVLEIVSGGELFERIIAEDFELTERECITYMLQINEGVQYIHKQEIVHLDLKPENIMCVNKTGARIKLIDFGLARKLESTSSLKVLFGTPEFVAPEVINYEPIGYPTDMWSIGVICYILVSGLSPFMGDNDNETLANVTSATWDFDDEAFDEISEDAKDFISGLLEKDMKKRMNCEQCLEHKWLKKDIKNMSAKKLSKERMKKYMARRKWQKTGHAVRAIGRLSSMANIAGLNARKSSVGNSPTSPTGDRPETEDEDTKVFLEEVNEEKASCKPFFSKTFVDVEVVEGSAARFDCRIEGYPDPEVMWFKDEQPIRESRHYQIEYDEEGNCSLIISDVTADDDGKYTCKAANPLGEVTWMSELLVEMMEESEDE